MSQNVPKCPNSDNANELPDPADLAPEPPL
jgi:hypothetical protein